MLLSNSKFVSGRREQSSTEEHSPNGDSEILIDNITSENPTEGS